MISAAAQSRLSVATVPPPAPRPRKGRVLFSTLWGGGGVETMASFVGDCLKRAGYEVVFANYQPYRLEPGLSVPIFDILRKRAGARPWVDEEGTGHHAIGAWLPELEFTHYWATQHWRRLIGACDYFVAVSGNALAATAFAQAGVPFLCWIASGWEADRKDRVRKFSGARRLLDGFVNAPVLRRLERRILARGKVLALSQYTAASLDDLAGSPVVDAVMPMPIDADLFRPDPARVRPGSIGFVGRFTDPRKNITLLLQTAAELSRRGVPTSLLLIGDSPSSGLQEALDRTRAAGIETVVRPKLTRAQLAAHLQTLDVFVVPSHQEGLCIAALEAMACGCPVVSTRCGGPEEFVIDGQTGRLSASDAAVMASAVASMVLDREERVRIGAAARQHVVTYYGRRAAEKIFWDCFDATFGERRDATCLNPS